MRSDCLLHLKVTSFYATTTDMSLYEVLKLFPRWPLVFRSFLLPLLLACEQKSFWGSLIIIRMKYMTKTTIGVAVQAFSGFYHLHPRLSKKKIVVGWRGLLKVQIIWKNGTAKAWTSSQVQSGFSTQIWCFCTISWVLYTRVPLHNLVVLNIRILYFCLARSCRRWWYWKDNLCQTSLDWRIWKKICWWVTYVIITSFRNFHLIRDTVCLNLTQNHVATDISFVLR